MCLFPSLGCSPVNDWWAHSSVLKNDDATLSCWSACWHSNTLYPSERGPLWRFPCYLLKFVYHSCAFFQFDCMRDLAHPLPGGKSCGKSWKTCSVHRLVWDKLRMLLWMPSILKKIAKPVENHVVLGWYFEGSALHPVAPVVLPPITACKQEQRITTHRKAFGQHEKKIALGSLSQCWRFGSGFYFASVEVPWIQVVCQGASDTCTEAKEGSKNCLLWTKNPKW